MKTTKIKPTATIVAQFAAGVEVTAISHEGNLYLPVISLGELAPKESAPTSDDDDKEETTEKKSDPKKESAESSSKTYTEDELMDMDVKALTKILKDDFGIDPSDYDGKNTNKKLRKLILDAQDGTEEADDEDEEEQPKKSPKKSSKKSEDKEEDEDKESDDDDDLAVKAGDILDDYDAGKNSKKKATSLLMKLVGTDDTDGVSKFLDKFDDDEDGDIDDYAQKFVDKFSDSDDDEDEDDDEEKEEAPKKRHSKKSEKKEDDEEYVAIEDLNKGDRVSVWWDDENKDWFDGTVKSVRGGKVTVAYDDDTEDVLDPKVNTKIKVLDED